MSIGTVKGYNEAKGFGFIAPDNGGKDVFVNISAVGRAGLGTLTDGQKINFDVERVHKPATPIRRHPPGRRQHP